MTDEELDRIDEEGCGCAMYHPDCCVRRLTAELRRLRLMAREYRDGMRRAVDGGEPLGDLKRLFDAIDGSGARGNTYPAPHK